jgi:phospholipid transport system substrate-binding protein
MTPRSIIFALAVGLIVIVNSYALTAAAKVPDPTEQFRPFVEKIVSILTNPDLQGEERCIQRRDKVMEVAAERFDFGEMSKRVLGRQWGELKDDDRKYFVFLFTKLLEHAYIGKIENYSKQKVVFVDQRIKRDRAQLDTKVVDKDVDISVSYIMMLDGDIWKVYDIVVEGVSLVRNYMEQFRDILRKEGYAHLIKQVEEKVTELEADIGKPCPVEIQEKSGA